MADSVGSYSYCAREREGLREKKEREGDGERGGE